jgi:hypothetical protein
MRTIGQSDDPVETVKKFAMSFREALQSTN